MSLKNVTWVILDFLSECSDVNICLCVAVMMFMLSDFYCSSRNVIYSHIKVLKT